MLRNPKAKQQDNNYQQKGEKDEKGNQKRIPTPSTFTSHCPPKENVETAQTKKARYGRFTIVRHGDDGQVAYPWVEW